MVHQVVRNAAPDVNTFAPTNTEISRRGKQLHVLYRICDGTNLGKTDVTRPAHYSLSIDYSFFERRILSNVDTLK